MIIFLDTSAITKRYVEEVGSSILDEIYAKCWDKKHLISFPIWNIGEVLGVFDKLKNRKILSENEFKHVINRFISECFKLLEKGNLIIFPCTTPILVDSWKIVLNNHIYLADALQITTAAALNSHLFLSADTSLIQIAKARNLSAFSVETELEQIIKKLS